MRVESAWLRVPFKERQRGTVAGPRLGRHGTPTLNSGPLLTCQASLSYSTSASASLLSSEPLLPAVLAAVGLRSHTTFCTVTRGAGTGQPAWPRTPAQGSVGSMILDKALNLGVGLMCKRERG